MAFFYLVNRGFNIIRFPFFFFFVSGLRIILRRVKVHWYKLFYFLCCRVSKALSSLKNLYVFLWYEKFVLISFFCGNVNKSFEIFLQLNILALGFKKIFPEIYLNYLIFTQIIQLSGEDNSHDTKVAI